MQMLEEPAAEPRAVQLIGPSAAEPIADGDDDNGTDNDWRERRRPTRGEPSRVWQYMDQTGPKEVTCRLCDKKMKFSKSTTGLLRHIKSRHDVDYPTVHEAGKNRPRNPSTVWQYMDVTGPREVTCRLCPTKIIFHGSTFSLLHHLKFKHDVDGVFPPLEEMSGQNSRNLLDNPMVEYSDTDDDDGKNNDKGKRKRKCRGKKWSAVWKYMEVTGPTEVTCRLCKAKLAYHGATTGLISHVKARHRIDDNILFPSKKQRTLLNLMDSEENSSDADDDIDYGKDNNVDTGTLNDIDAGTRNDIETGIQNEEANHPVSVKTKRNNPGKWSVVWQYMQRSGRREVTCRICKAKFAYHGATSGLLTHIQVKHTEDGVIPENPTEEMQEQINRSLLTDPDMEFSDANSDFDNGAENDEDSGKRKRKRSMIWQYMQRTGSKEVTCRICRTKMAYHGATTGLISHVQAKHFKDGTIPENPSAEMQEQMNRTMSMNADLDFSDANNGADNGQVSVKKKRNATGKWSVVWKYMDKTGPKEVTCRICKAKMAYHGATTGLIAHVQGKHFKDGAIPENPSEELMQGLINRNVMMDSDSSDADNGFDNDNGSDNDWVPEERKRTRPSQGKKLPSVVWQYMDVTGPKEVTCCICKAKLAYNSSTSGLLAHIQAKHTVDGIIPGLKKKQSRNSRTWLNESEVDSSDANDNDSDNGTDDDWVAEERRKKASKKSLRKPSVVWQYMNRTGPREVTCRLCETKIVYNNSTTNLMGHIRTKHTEDGVIPSRGKKTSDQSGQDPEMSSNFLEEPIDIEIDVNSEKEDEPVQSQSTGSKKRKDSKRGQSVAWDYFEKIDEQNVRCLVCQRTQKFFGSTSALILHIQNRHTNLPPDEAQRVGEIVAKQRELNRAKLQSNSTLLLASKSKVLCENKRYCRSANGKDGLILRWLIDDMLPFSVVENKFFRQMIKRFDLNYKLPSKEHMEGYLLGKVNRITQTVLLKELESVQSISISTEIWSHQKELSILSVTGHYICSNWQVKSVMLDNVKLPEGYTPEMLANELYRVLETWQIARKVFCVTTDTSDAMRDAVGRLNVNHQICFAQNINELIESSIEAVPEIKNLEEKITNIVNFFRTNTTASDSLDASQQDEVESAKVLEGRGQGLWFSLFAMFQRYVELHNHVTKVLNEPNHADNQDLVISEQDLATLKETVQALEPFHLATGEMAKEALTCMSKVFPMTKTLRRFLENSPLTGSLAEELKKQMTGRFSNFEANLFSSASTYLDPRFKMVAFEDPDTATNVREELKSMMSLEIENAAVKNNNKLTKEDASLSLLWSDFDIIVQEQTKTSSADSYSARDKEFDIYDKERLIMRTQDPLEWWKFNGKLYPNLLKLVCQFLAVPATHKKPELMFTSAGTVETIKRDLYSDSSVCEVLFLKQNSEQSAKSIQY